MKKTVLFLTLNFLFLVQSVAQPVEIQWTLLTPLNSNLNVYYDASSIIVAPSHPDYKTIHLLFQPSTVSTIKTSTSILAITTIDCKNLTGKTESLLFFTQPWARGEPSTTASEANNSRPAPLRRENVYDQKLIEVVCE